MGMRYAGDPDWGYRLPRASLVSVLALERVEASERTEAAQGARKAPVATPPRKAAPRLSHPSVVCASPEAAAFWGLT